MDNDELLINKILEKIQEAASKGLSLTLTPEEVKELDAEFGDQVFIPIVSMEELAQISRDKKS